MTSLTPVSTQGIEEIEIEDCFVHTQEKRNFSWDEFRINKHFSWWTMKVISADQMGPAGSKRETQIMSTGSVDARVEENILFMAID